MAVTSPCRYSLREITTPGGVVGYAVHQSWHEDGQLRSQVIRAFSPDAGWAFGGVGTASPDLYSAYVCAKGMVEALNG